MSEPSEVESTQSTLKENGKNSSTGLNKPVKELFVWNSVERPFKTRDKKFYTTLIAIAFIVGLVLFLIDGWAPVILIISLVFLFYVMSTVEPAKIENKITEDGVLFSTSFTPWDNLGRFWFTKRMDHDVVVFETNQFPGRIEIVVNPGDKRKIQEILEKRLVHEEIPPSGLDRAAIWFSKKLPQE